MYLKEMKSLSQISQITKMPKSRIRKILIKNNIKLRDKSSCQCINLGDKEKFVNFDFKTLKSQSKIKRKCQSFFKNHIASKVKEMRGNKCEICGSTNNLHAHHLRPQSLIISDIIKDYRNKNMEELYNIVIRHPKYLDLNNIKVVCEKCHYTIYHPYTNYNINYRQISSQAQKREGSTTTENISNDISE